MHTDPSAQHATGLAWQTLMHGVARLMKALATRCNVAVVCTTHTVGGAQVLPSPCLLGMCPASTRFVHYWCNIT